MRKPRKASPKVPPKQIMPYPLRLPSQLRRRLEDLAHADRRKLSVYLVMALEQHVAAIDAAGDAHVASKLRAHHDEKTKV